MIVLNIFLDLLLATKAIQNLQRLAINSRGMVGGKTSLALFTLHPIPVPEARSTS